MAVATADLLTLISSYLALQLGLLAELRAAHPDVDDWDNLIDLPRRGTVTYAGESWRFQRHGCGVCFTGAQSGRVVDPHNKLDICTRGLDACRLERYFESLGITAVTWNGRTWPVDFDDMKDLVAALQAAGALVPAPECPELLILAAANAH